MIEHLPKRASGFIAERMGSITLDRIFPQKLNSYVERTVQNVSIFATEKVLPFAIKTPPTKWAVDFLAARVIDNLVILKSSHAVDQRFQELVAAGMIPINYSDHEGHADGIGIAKASEHQRDLTLQPKGLFRWRKRYLMPGVAAIFAKSMITGDQSEDLKSTYDLLIGGGRQKGVEPIPVTRKKDQKKYNMSRLKVAAELIPLIRKLRQGYGMAFLPEGSVQGGRHLEGTSIEDIYGMQEIDNNNLVEFFQLVSEKVKDRRPFFVPIALYGSFRIIQSTENEDDKPKLTPQGKRSLIRAALGRSSDILKIEATLLMPFTEEDIVADLGPKWMEDGKRFNRYAMEKLLPGLPPIAWGFYGRPAEGATQAIELSGVS